MQERYLPEKIEPKWQRYWEENAVFSVSPDPSRPKFYCLEMFPYPSGRIHMGHVRNYAIGDVVARFARMRGLNVLHPMGWDAFGLPAENAAIDKGIHPAEWTSENIATMRSQLKKMGFSYDWEREIATCNPEYYRWNQWFFLQMFKRGLAYKKRARVNWCPGCETVLANEQVVDGLCWRCDCAVVEKDLEQWFFKITEYADRLLSDLAVLEEGWPQRVITQQRNWIGKSEGVYVTFPFADRPGGVSIFTTRADTLFGATFLTLAAEHPAIESLIAGRQEGEAVSAFLKKQSGSQRSRGAAEPKKEGVFTGAYSLNPFTGERMPIWVGNFVLMEYGTGAVMAVPAHDQRDFEFAREYFLPIRVVVQPDGLKPLRPEGMDRAYVEEAGRIAESGEFSGLDQKSGKEAIVKAIEVKGFGKRGVNWRLRDWGISRQRYWGTPIPILYCKTCGIVPVPENDLPVLLPRDVPFTGKGGSPLAENPRFVDAPCPSCRGPARRETDTMDTFVDSSWYFLRFASPHTNRAPFEFSDAAYWMPVDQYIGGIEHAVLHLLYARFFTKVIKDVGLISQGEPFLKLLTQGMVVKETFRCPRHGYLFVEESSKDPAGLWCALCEREGRQTLIEVGRMEKMSKSKKNIVDPDRLMERYGADTARLFSLFAAPPEKDLEWSAEGVEGARRFLERLFRLVARYADLVKSAPASVPDELPGHNPMELGALETGVPPDLSQARKVVHRTIRKVTEDLERFRFNTAIAAIMEMVNTWYKIAYADRGVSPFEQAREIAKWREPWDGTLSEAIRALIRMLAPFAPHIAEELWERIGGRPSVMGSGWPSYDATLMVEEEVDLVIQVNGKVRGKIRVPAGLSDEEARDKALEVEKVRRHLGGKPVRKTIVVKDRLVNLVV